MGRLSHPDRLSSPPYAHFPCSRAIHGKIRKHNLFVSNANNLAS